MPTVSILLPNLNNACYLEERFESILSQTFQDWELIVVDGYSDDGAWDIIQKYVAIDNRIKASQSRRDGIYAGINKCFFQSSGKLIYIATSDDTMYPICLERMVEALHLNPECGIAHCCLTVIDHKSNVVHPNPWDTYSASRFYGQLMSKEHIRYAPLDGILHAFIDTVYTSLTQLLVCRSVYSSVGLFSCEHGSWADFGWAMKASLLCNTVHIPRYLATWRFHPNQATDSNLSKNPTRYLSFIKMTSEAVEASLPMLNAADRKIILEKSFLRYYKLKYISLLRACDYSFSSKMVRLISSMFVDPGIVKNAFLGRLFPGYSINLNEVNDALKFCNQHDLMSNILLLDQ